MEHEILFCFQSMEKCIGVEWELEQTCDVSLLTNPAVKVVYLYLKFPPK